MIANEPQIIGKRVDNTFVVDEKDCPISAVSEVLCDERRAVTGDGAGYGF